MNSHLVNMFSFGIATFVLWMLVIPYFIKFVMKTNKRRSNYLKSNRVSKASQR